MLILNKYPICIIFNTVHIMHMVGTGIGWDDMGENGCNRTELMGFGCEMAIARKLQIVGGYPRCRSDGMWFMNSSVLLMGIP